VAKNSATPTTQTTEVKLDPRQNELIDLAMPGLRTMAGTGGPRLPDFSGVAGFDPMQRAGQNLALGTAVDQYGVTRGAADATNRATRGDFMNVESNPALAGIQDTINSRTRSTVDNLLEQALPSIRSGAAVSGNYGSSRQGIAEGLATGRAARAVGDIGAETTTNVAMKGYDSGLDAMMKAIGLAPQTTQNLLAPALTVSGVGDVRQGQNQRELDEASARWNYQEQLPLLMSRELMGLVSGIPTAGATTTGTTPRSGPTAMNALGGAASGAALGSALFPGIGTMAGAGIGALLPFLSR